MGRTTTSLRFEEKLRERLAQRATSEGISVTALVERLVLEGLAIAEHPGVVFKPGPSGRRAALAGGPDIWEIAAALRHTTGTEAARITALSQEFGIHERQIVIALNYAAAHRDEIAARIKINDDAAAALERMENERQRLFA